MAQTPPPSPDKQKAPTPAGGSPAGGQTAADRQGKAAFDRMDANAAAHGYTKVAGSTTKTTHNPNSVQSQLRAREADSIFNQPDMQALNDQGDAIIRDNEANPMGYRSGDSSDSGAQKKQGFIGRLRNNRRRLIGLGAGGGIVLSLIAGFYALIPLKLEMLVKSATQHAAEIPEYAIEHRLSYLTSRYLAHKVLGVVNPADSYPSTSVAHNLFKTWQAERIEDQFNIKITSDRTNNGQTATKWTVAFTDTDVLHGTGDDIVNMTKQIDSSKEMRTFIKGQFKQKTKWYQFYKRYSVRKTLMRVKGVTSWAWLPDSVTDKIDNYNAKKAALTSKLKIKLYDDTVGRVMPRMGLYLACLSDGAVCKELHNRRFGASLDSPDTTGLQTDCPGGDQACIDEQTRLAQEGADGTKANAGDVSAGSKEVGEKLGEESGKFVTKQLLSKAVAGIGIIDTLARIVNGLDNGNLNQIIYDRNSIMAAGYSTEITSINDQMKALKLGYDQLDAVMTQIGDYGSSPAWQAEIGIISPAVLAASHFERSCGSDGDKTVLGLGETVCPERKIITDKLSFTNQLWWDSFSQFATAWVKGPGKVFDLFGKLTGVLGIDKAIGAILNATGINSLLGKGMSSMLELVFGSPISALDTNGEAGDDMLGGIKSTYYALGEAGQDTDQEGADNGKGLGIGGGVFTPTQTAALKSQIAQENQQEWSQQSAFAKLFDLSDTRSVLSQLVLRVPTDSSQLAMFPSVFQSSIMGLINPHTSAAGPVKDQFGFDFNYGFTDAQLTADPAQYTTDECAKLAKDREDSYVPGHEVSKDIPIYVYKKADPCALEKVVAAAGAAEYDDEYSPDFALTEANAADTTGPTTPGGGSSTQDPSKQGFVWPIDKADFKPLNNCYRKPPNGHTGIDIPVPVGTKVYAANAGKVVRTDPGGGSDGGKYIIIQGTNGYWTNYQHLSVINVKEGDTVTAGQNIGVSGNTGNTTGPHLHFSVTTREGLDSRNSVAYSVNPIPFLPTDGRSLGVCG